MKINLNIPQIDSIEVDNIDELVEIITKLEEQNNIKQCNYELFELPKEIEEILNYVLSSYDDNIKLCKL